LSHATGALPVAAYPFEVHNTTPVLTSPPLGFLILSGYTGLMTLSIHPNECPYR